MVRGVPSRVWVFALSLVALFSVLLFAVQSSIAAQSGAGELRRPSREGAARPVVELPRFLDGPGTTPPPAARAADMPELPWSRIVFYDRNSDKWDIYSITDDSDSPLQLTNSWAVEVEPDMSRGGGTVIYSSDEGGDFEIMAMSASGAGAHPLTNNSKNDGQPRFSPDNGRIVFVSERDGQAEIYTMKPDGSAQTRLTNAPGYDGDPAWSPDGKQIVFSSQRTGFYRIWVMDADGGNPRQLSDTPYSVAPVWSPDGAQIVFSAEGDSDGFLDLMLMNADGSDELKLHNAAGAADAIARSWSPDGEQIAFTQWNYVPYQGQWYIGSTRLMTITPGDYNADSLSGGVQYPFGPAWQSLDTIAPQSAMATLAAVSPAEVQVSWQGTDRGGSAVRSFDVQMRLNDGVWTDWQMGTREQTATYLGIGGQKPAFRVRARDNALNVEPWSAGPGAVTTIESLPPVSTMTPLPDFTRAGESILVAWAGHDPGGSGISGFSVQYRLDAGTWTTLLPDTLDRHILFTPEQKGVAPGQTVAFRVRAVDKAQNEEVWPPEGGDTATTIFQWVAVGRVTDNIGVPVGGAAVMSSPEPIQPATSGVEGDYSLFGKDDVPSVRLSWAKPGYGPLPSTPFQTSWMIETNIVLPPVDDVIKGGGFEGAWPGADWTTGGTLPLSPTTAVVGSGETALQFSRKQDAFGAPETITPASDATAGSQRLFIVDGTTPVALWAINDHGLYEASRASGGWSAPNHIFKAVVDTYVATEDEQGQIHVVARAIDNNSGMSDSFYLRRSETGQWSSPERLPRTDHGEPLAIMATPDGRVHLLVVDEFGFLLFYQQRTASGWGPSEAVNPPNTVVDDACFIVVPNGTVVIVWAERLIEGLATSVVARDRRPDQTWSGTTTLFQTTDLATIDLARLLRDGSGRLHLAWSKTVEAGTGSLELGYVQRTIVGWGRPEAIPHSMDSIIPRDMVLSNEGEPRLAVSTSPYTTTGGPGRSVLFARNPDGSWQTAQTIVDAYSYGIRLAVDAADRTHIAWAYDEPYGNVQIGYRWREPSGELASLWVMGGADNEWPPELALDSAGRRHLLFNTVQWTSPDAHYSVPAPVLYAVSRDSTGTGLATISQTVTVPANGHPVLSFHYSYSGATTGQSGFTAEVDGDAHNLAVGDLTHTWLDLSAYRGRTIPITFRLRQAEGDPASWAALDDVSLGTAYADVWLAAGGGAALPGETADLVIRAGNRAGVAAEGVAVMLALPPELSFVRAVPAPSAPLRWELGALAPGAEQTIVVTVQVSAMAKPLTTVSLMAEATAANELETLNNSAAAVVALQRMLYLPGVATP
jgi:Tol biopolymer transport system component